LAEVDDFRLVPERMTTPEQQPELHSLLALFDIESQPWSPPGAVCDALIKVAHIMSYALEIVVANHVATDTPTIIEGDRIVPAFAAQRVLANRDSGARFGQCSSSKRTETDWRETRRREDAPLSHCQHTSKNSTFV